MDYTMHTANNAKHYPLMLRATYSCCAGKHSFWHTDAMAEQRTDYSGLMSIADAVAEFAKTNVGLGGTLVLATDPLTARKITGFFKYQPGNKRQVSLEQRLIQFEPDIPVPDDLPEPVSTFLPMA